jgi:hypothetical protein
VIDWLIDCGMRMSMYDNLVSACVCKGIRG